MKFSHKLNVKNQVQCLKVKNLSRVKYCSFFCMKYIHISFSWFCFEILNTIIFVRSTIILDEIDRSSPLEVFLGKSVLKVHGKFMGEHPRRNVISIKLQFTFTHGCSPVKLLYIFRIPFNNNTSGGLLLIRRDFLTQFSPVLHFKEKPVFWFALNLPCRSNDWFLHEM